MTAVLADERFRGPTKPGRRTQAARRTRAMPIGLIPVDRSSPVPLYYQVARYLEAAIESGEMSPGSWLDNEVHLATELRLSRPTVRRAIQYLVDKGLVVRKRGVGTKVVHAQVKRPIELTSRYDDLSRTGQRPTMRVLANDIEAAAGPVAHALHLPEGTPVIALGACGVREASPSPASARSERERPTPLRLSCSTRPRGRHC
jgi:DNA-binding transcriptional regulator YhcF (GntR family)